MPAKKAVKKAAKKKSVVKAVTVVQKDNFPFLEISNAVTNGSAENKNGKVIITGFRDPKMPTYPGMNIALPDGTVIRIDNNGMDNIEHWWHEMEEIVD